MTIDSPHLVRCPACRGIYILRQFSSVTVRRAQIWSDGFNADDSFDPQEAAPIAFCGLCREWHEIDAFVPIVVLPWDISPRMVGEISTMTPLDADQLQDALGTTWSRETERALRIQLLWLQNGERRNRTGDTQSDAPPLCADLHANLERLSELIDPELTPALAAEINRELGEFSRVHAIVAKHIEAAEPEVAETLLRIDSAATERSILPFLIASAKGDEMVFGREELKEIVDTEGLYPLPMIEDVVPFPTEEMHRRIDPALLVRLDTIDSQWKGWAPILDDGVREFEIVHNRSFSPDDFERYEATLPEWKDELQWFWGRFHFDVDPAGTDGDRYYRTLYQIYYDYFIPESDFGFDLDTESFRVAFDAHYYGKNVRDEGDYYFLFWNVYWASFATRIPDPTEPEFPGLPAIRRQVAKEEREVRRRQRNAVDGLSYFEGGGDPRWFQGLDHTPSIEGRAYEFIGQIWLDYLNAGFRLVYLFFDPVTRRTYQVYDYD